ncbi:hypothetical protein BASA81_002967 [Batrachochytrium salamandrivorans]|nr:hypothetical protein BASA81_002967 [Batrachochytrium salamandrivorans]
MLSRLSLGARRIPSSSSAFISTPFSVQKEERRSIHSAAQPKLGPSTWMLIISGAFLAADKLNPAANLLNETAEEKEFIRKTEVASKEQAAKETHHH